MRHLVRPLLIITLALLVPIVPFLGFGEALEAKIAAWFDPSPAPLVLAAATVALLASDILLPVPSSLVSTLAGSQLGVVAGTFVSWLGMTLGAVVGFYLARQFGRAITTRLSSADDLARMDRVVDQYGFWVVILTRPLPVLAEAAVLLLGTTELAWAQFLPAMALSNAGIAFVYSALGQVAHSQGQLPLALGASIALPVLAASVARLVWRADRPGISNPAGDESLPP
jgi:uncharacterized membrane protein YdjX (TVP38/TMEM64 family)